MGTWIVKTNGDPDDEPLITIVAYGDGSVSLHMPSPDPVVVTARKVEEVRWALAAGINPTRTGGSAEMSDEDDDEAARGSHGGDDRG